MNKLISKEARAKQFVEIFKNARLEPFEIREYFKGFLEMNGYKDIDFRTVEDKNILQIVYKGLGVIE